MPDPWRHRRAAVRLDPLEAIPVADLRVVHPGAPASSVLGDDRSGDHDGDSDGVGQGSQGKTRR